MSQEPYLDPQTIVLVGHPVSHSLSPLMHNAAFQALGLNLRYTTLDVPKGRLKAQLCALREVPIAGVNVTLPYKRAVASLVDALTPAAELSGAVNTLYWQDDLLWGDDTDGAGYLASLASEHSFAPQGSRVLILGCGGAAQSVATALSLAGAAEIIFAVRSTERAKPALERVRPPCQARAVPLDESPLWEAATAPELVINATPLGLHAPQGSHDYAQAVAQFNHWLAPRTCRALFSDLIYTPRATAFVAVGEALGGTAHTGLGMLLHQGALGFERWTGRGAPLDVMSRALEDALAGGN